MSAFTEGDDPAHQQYATCIRPIGFVRTSRRRLFANVDVAFCATDWLFVNVGVTGSSRGVTAVGAGRLR